MTHYIDFRAHRSWPIFWKHALRGPCEFREVLGEDGPRRMPHYLVPFQCEYAFFLSDFLSWKEIISTTIKKKKEIIDQTDLEELWEHGLDLWVLWCAGLCLVAQSCPTLCDPMDCSPSGSSVLGDSPGKNAGVGCHALLQEIFPTQG